MTALVRGHSQHRLMAAVCLALTLIGCDGDVLGPRRKPPGELVTEARTSSSSLVATATSPTQIYVSWTDNAPNESGWEIWRSTTGVTGPFTLLTSVGPNATSYSNSGLTGGAQYCYKVRSYKKSGPNIAYGEFLNTACVTTLVAPPTASNLSAAYGDNAWVTVVWTSPPSTVSSLRLERSLGADGPFSSIAQLDVSATVYSDRDVLVEQLYCYRVTSSNDSAEASSNVDCTARPSAPSNVAARPRDAQTVNISWTDNSRYETQYEIQRSLDGASGETIATLGANVASYTDGGLTSNTRYYYRVGARSDDASPAYSGWVLALPVSGPPAAPTLERLFPNCSTCITAYGTADGATAGIRIERSATGGGWVTALTQSASPGYWYFSEGGLATEQQVCYRAFAFNSAGESPPSNTHCTSPPAAPSDVSVSWLPDFNQEVRWTNHSSVADGVLVVTLYLDLNNPACELGCETERHYYISDPTATQTVILGDDILWYVCATRDGGCSDRIRPATTATASRFNTVPPALRSKLPEPLRDVVERGRPHLRKP